MRRALLLAVLAAPALVAAQTAPLGSILFADGAGTDYVHGPYINEAECTGSDPVWLTWNIGASSIPTTATYQVYASSQPHPSTGCTTQGNVTANPPLFAGAVGAPVSAITPIQTQAYFAAQFATVTGVTCTTTADTPIYVCVQLSSGATVLTAKGTLTVSTASPAPPTNVAVASMDGALGISWTAPSGGPPAYDYRVVASADPATDPYVHAMTVGGIGAVVGVSLTGLVNGATYDVQIYSRSQAGNESAPSTAVQGAPIASRDTLPRLPRPSGGGSGGCATGTAAPLALLGAAALLGRVRRRPRGR